MQVATYTKRRKPREWESITARSGLPNPLRLLTVICTMVTEYCFESQSIGMEYAYY